MVARPQVLLGKGRNVQLDDLHRLSETRGTLWLNGSQTYNGINDQIPFEQTARETSSLTLIHVDELRLRVFAPSAAFGNAKRRVQARFQFASNAYALWVTDPRIERAYLANDDGNYTLRDCFLTISLGEPFKDHCHKLVAAVIKRPA